MRTLILSLLLFAMSGPTFPASVEEGKPAPHLAGKLLDGTPFNLQNMRGRVVIVSFWASWCPNCRKEMPLLNELYTKYHAQGLDVIGISIDDSDDAVAQVKSAIQGFSYQTALLSSVNADEFGRIWRIPLTFVIDKNGILRRDAFQHDPNVDEAELEQIIRPLLSLR